MLIYLENHPIPPRNTTFINDLVFQSKIIPQSSMLRFLIKNIVAANSDISFQFADPVFSGTGDSFTIAAIKDKIFK